MFPIKCQDAFPAQDSCIKENIQPPIRVSYSIFLLPPFPFSLSDSTHTTATGMSCLPLVRPRVLENRCNFWMVIERQLKCTYVSNYTLWPNYLFLFAMRFAYVLGHPAVLSGRRLAHLEEIRKKSHSCA